MLAIIVALGALVVTPNLYVVRRLEDTLLSRILRLPPVVLRALLLQVRNSFVCR